MHNEKKVGDWVDQGDVIAEIHWSFSDNHKIEYITKLIQDALIVADKRMIHKDLNFVVISKEDLYVKNK